MHSNALTRTIPTTIGLLTALKTLCARARSSQSRSPQSAARLRRSPRPIIARLSHASDFARRDVRSNSLSSTLPTQLDRLTALSNLCARRACARLRA
jgi:hypothetical protein